MSKTPKRKINTKDLVNKIERLAKERIRQEKVVSIADLQRFEQPVEPPTILIIEDDETLRTAMRRLLSDEGYQVLTAADGTQLSGVLEDRALDLIILDIGLPWINGFELAEMMKAHRDLKSLPLIFVSGRVSEEDVKKGFAVGADDYIKKPFNIESLRKTVTTLLRLNQK